MAIKEVENNEEARMLTIQVNRYAGKLESFRVTSQDSFVSAQEMLKDIKLKIREIEDVRKGFTDPLDMARKRAMEFFGKPIDKLKEIYKVIETSAITWKNEQERKERERQEEKERIAREKEREERERLRKEAEKKRLEAEKLAAQAKAAEKKGDTVKAWKLSEKMAEKKEEAQVLKQESKTLKVAPKEVATRVERVEGVAYRKNWKFRIKDANKIPRSFLKPDEVAIGEYVRKEKENAVIPGVEVYFEEGTAITNGNGN